MGHEADRHPPETPHVQGSLEDLVAVLVSEFSGDRHVLGERKFFQSFFLLSDLLQFFKMELLSPSYELLHLLISLEIYVAFLDLLAC